MRSSLPFSSFLAICALGFALPHFTQAEVGGTLEAPLQEYPSTAAAWLDLPQASVNTSQKVSEEAHGVEVWQEESGSAPLPARLRQTADGLQILWQVPAMKSDEVRGQEKSFSFKIAEGENARGLAETDANLLDNGDFQRATAEALPDAFDSRHGRLDDEGDRKALSFAAFSDGNVPVCLSPLIALKPNERYAVSFDYSIEGASPGEWGNTLFAYINFYGKNDEQLLEKEGAIRRIPIIDSKEETSGGWLTVEHVFTVPYDAVAATLEIRMGSSTPYAVKISNLRIKPVEIPKAKLGAVTHAGSDGGRQLAGGFFFDLGPESSPAFTESLAITPRDIYQPKRGYGFRETGPRLAFDNGRPDSLARDFITGGKIELQVDLPDGEYLLWVLTCDNAANQVVRRHYFNQSLSANGVTLYSADPRPSSHILAQEQRGYEAFWTPGMDYYDTFIASEFQKHEARVKVEGGRLLISWSNLPVAALMARPVVQKEEMETALASIYRQQRRDAGVAEISPTVPAITPKVAGDAAVAIYRQSADRDLYPWVIGEGAERLSELSGFAVPGQVEALWFTVHIPAEMESLRVAVTELKSKEGTIPADAFDIRIARYLFRSADGKGQPSAYRYQLAAFPLDEARSVPAAAGLNWTWWLNLRVPAAASAGLYEGKAEVFSGDRVVASLPIKFRVLPFQLEELPISQGYYYFPSEPWYSAFWGGNVMGKKRDELRKDPQVIETIVANEKRELAFMKDLGLNSVAFGDDMRGEWQFQKGEVRLRENDRFSLWMDLYRDAGFGPMPFYGFTGYGPIEGSANLLSWVDPSLSPPFTPRWIEAYRGLVRSVNERARSRQWPEIIWYVSDESSNHGQPAADRTAEVARLLQGQEGVKTIASLNGPFETVVVPTVSISMPNFGFPITQETVEMIAKEGGEPWYYNIGDRRVMLGLWPWRMKAKGRFQWHFREMNARPWDDLGSASNFTRYSVAYPSPNGPIPTLRSEVLRAAILDQRYLATLEKQMALRRNDPHYADALKRADQFLAALREKIPVDPIAMTDTQLSADDVSAGVLKPEWGNDDAMQRIRWAVANLVMDLNPTAL